MIIEATELDFRSRALTDWDFSLLHMICLPNKVIAKRMNVTEMVVKHRYIQLYERLGVPNRCTALSEALSKGFVCLSDLEKPNSYSGGVADG